jgi:predicted metalloendopeptidase
MRLFITLIASLVAFVTLTACSPKQPTATVATPKAAIGTFGIDLTAMDKAVKPGDDFFKYVNGTWLATFKMPPDKTRYGAFDELRDKAEADVHGLLEELKTSRPAPGSVQQKVLDLYNSWMDESAIEARGFEPLKPYLAAIDAAKTKADVVRLMSTHDYASAFSLYIDADPADPTRYVVNVGQGGLGLPDRDFYLDKNERFERYRAAYATYVAKVFELIGDPNPAASAATVIALETKLAATHWERAKRRDVIATNNPMDVTTLKDTVRAIDWDAFLPAAGLGSVQHVVVKEKTAVQDSAALLDTEPVDAWKKFLAFHVASDNASSLPKAFDDANFNFYRKTLNGQEVQRDRWKRGVGLLDGLIGEGVGQLYVAKFFPARSKAQMNELVANLSKAMGERLKTLSWMDDATRAAAQKKLATFEPRVGYPAKWRDYTAYKVEPGKLFENVRAGREFEWQRQIARLDAPVDRDEWAMNAQTVNAYYDPLMNQITFPAAILQPPFFDPNADPAVNYGAIGAVIGHEMGHGFDDQGSEFDEAGKIRNWWTPETKEKFKAATTRLGAEYSAFCPLPDQCINGAFTMGENIGDLGGLEMAYTAYKISLGGKTAPVIDGFTGDQRFFMAHAQVWRGMYREDAQVNQLRTDPHSPAAARGSIPERNVDAWYAAFGVRETDKAFIKPEDRVHIW